MQKTLCRLLLALPLVLFMDWIIMTVFGCIAEACNANNHFYCSVYCYTGIFLVTISLIGGCYFVLKATKKQEA